jgi:uncharacterized damage-inducible protein DinB
MTYYGAKQMADGFRTVRKNTIVIAEEIGEEHYGFRPTPEARSVAQLLMHIGVAPQMTEQIHALERRTSLVDFDFPAFFVRMQNEEQRALPKVQIIEFLRTEGDRFATWLEGVSDDFLGESVKFPPGMTPPTKTRFEMILGVKEHEMHHRGQLMLIERLLGQVPHMTRQMQARIEAMMAAPKP